MPLSKPSTKKIQISAFPKEPLRSAFRDSMPSIASEPFSKERIPLTYVPPSHARALDPNSILVEGIRGAGKSFWWNALNQKAHREFVVSAFPETRLNLNMRVGPGYGLGPGDDNFPSKDVIRSLVAHHEPRSVWKAVIAKHLEFPSPFPERGNWEERVSWVQNSPEMYDTFLLDADKRLLSKNETYVILFDALDRLAEDWSSLRPIAKALFQVALDIRNYRSIRLKLFVRPDMLQDSEMLGFPDSSKLKGEKVSLTWRKVDLFALAFQCLWNDSQNGLVFRKHVQLLFPTILPLNAQVLPQPLRTDEDLQKKVFHALAGPTMASGESGHKRGFPYTWLPNHLADGREQVSPRSFSAALREAASYDLPQGWQFPIHFRGLQAGVQTASGIRVSEIAEDFPWVTEVMKPLKQVVVPCAPNEFFKRWKSDGVVESLKKNQLQKLPPQNLHQGNSGLIEDLEFLGIIQRLNDGRIQMPDVYRIAFGLGRKGGVKPVK